MHLTALVDGPDHVCCRYRLAAFRPYLEQAGHQLTLCTWPRSWWSRLRLSCPVRHADCVILQRRLMSGWKLSLLRRAAPLILFDFDDAVFGRDSYDPKGHYSLRRVLAFAAMVETADAVIAGNEFLRRQAARWTDPARIELIPTCVDPSPYSLAPHVRAEAGVELVWIGSSSTLRGLEVIRPILETIGRRCPGLSLKLICDRFLQLEHLPVQACPWSEAGEAAALAGADIGISWVPDDAWSRGKCGLKVLQYMAAGLPVVANPVGVQAEMIRPGENGFLARTAEEWVEAVTRLSRDPELRRRLGRAGRQRVEAEFSVSVGAARWLALLERLASKKEAA